MWKASYLTSSTAFSHPAGFFSNNLDDVRDEWERIKLSYEILSDKKTRRRYDRHVMIADPKGAMSRAAMDAVGKGITGLGQGLFNIGAFAVQQMTKQKGNAEKP